LRVRVRVKAKRRRRKSTALRKKLLDVLLNILSAIVSGLIIEAVMSLFD